MSECETMVGLFDTQQGPPLVEGVIYTGAPLVEGVIYTGAPLVEGVIYTGAPLGEGVIYTGAPSGEGVIYTGDSEWGVIFYHLNAVSIIDDFVWGGYIIAPSPPPAHTTQS